MHTLKTLAFFLLEQTHHWATSLIISATGSLLRLPFDPSALLSFSRERRLRRTEVASDAIKVGPRDLVTVSGESGGFELSGRLRSGSDGEEKISGWFPM